MYTGLKYKNIPDGFKILCNERKFMKEIVRMICLTILCIAILGFLAYAIYLVFNLG